jgi:hypothetical protein
MRIRVATDVIRHGQNTWHFRATCSRGCARRTVCDVAASAIRRPRRRFRSCSPRAASVSNPDVTGVEVGGRSKV